MKFERLRLAGFKSFCDPTEFKIEPGLTGVVGPNGCGKSNLVEALRWVMGENSYKNMRASGMEDVIFSGSGRRPSRNIAEVGLTLDNSDRRAPAAFNDSETIEVIRRIERDKGSSYKINGREARARDVQLLFADASTGARSPAMVRQGQIGEIIAAKPAARRLVLEEAAGVAGLHSRRHEAELRLKAAEDNLARVEDVLRQFDSQVESLRRQARQSQRYKSLAADIRRYEALAKLIAWRDAEASFVEAERAFAGLTGDVAERTRAQAESARAQAMAAADLPALRDEEARAGAALHRLTAARDALAADEKRAEARAAELSRRVEQLSRDIEREQSLVADAAEAIARLDAEAETLAAQDEAGEARAEAEAREAEAAETLAEAEAALAAAQSAAADFTAQRNALGSALDEEIRRWRRFEDEVSALTRDRAALPGSGADEAAFDEAAADLEERMELLAEAEAAALEAEESHAAARGNEAAARAPLGEAERLAQRLETEARTLEKLLGSAAGGEYPPVLDAIVAERGYETALGAALGDDLDASTVEGAPARWAGADADGDAPLPAGVESLALHIAAPAALGRRLAQIGVVARAEGSMLAARLKPGQRLVSREGDLWRWDGYIAAAEAPTPAARRLVEKNRLGDLVDEGARARDRAEALKREAERGGGGGRRGGAPPPPPRPPRERERARPAPTPIPGASASPPPSASVRRRAPNSPRSMRRSRARRLLATRRSSGATPPARRCRLCRPETSLPPISNAPAPSPGKRARATPRPRRSRAISRANWKREWRGGAPSPRSADPGAKDAPRRRRISAKSPSAAAAPRRNWKRWKPPPPNSRCSAARC
jgi:chromosome segregation protein